MNQTEIDFLNFENDLLQTRRKLNDLIYQFSHNPQTPENKTLYQEKIFYLETELTYMNKQFQMLKSRQTLQQKTVQNMPAAIDRPNLPRKDYEKLFGKSFMGIFASVLIFISLIIFATLMMPYLTDTMKLFGIYILSFYRQAFCFPAKTRRTDSILRSLAAASVRCTSPCC